MIALETRPLTNGCRVYAPPPSELAPGTEAVEVILIKPSCFDEDGYMLSGVKQGIASNSNNVMHKLTEVALNNILPEHIPFRLHVFDEGVAGHFRELKKLMGRFPRKGTKLIVGLVGVQSMQFERARQIAFRWQRRGATVVIGGFHVTTTISTMFDGIEDKRHMPCPHVMPPEVQDLLDRGIIVFHGAAEETWQEALSDILRGRPKRLYRGKIPDLWQAPLPHISDALRQRDYLGSTITINTSDGCVFLCSFCSIINQPGGRTMRSRDPKKVAEFVEQACALNSKVNVFFTDDNFARNPHWEELLNGLIALRTRGLKISIMVEADLACGTIPNFLEKLAAAGCYQIFMGVESMNPKNLKEAHKWQNNVQGYSTLWERCHKLGMSVHAGYIIGFKFDTPESVKADIQALKGFGVDIVSLFILSPVPGSEDHVRAVVEGVRMDKKLSRFSSFVPVTDHPNPLVTQEVWQKMYDDSWRQFYTADHMRSCLQHCKNKSQHRALQRVYLWYCWALFAENVHPMNSPFLKVRFYSEHDPDLPQAPYWKFCLEETWRYSKYFVSLLREFYRFQQVNLPIRERLNGFWSKYASEKWKLLWKWNWHISAIPRVFGEAACWLYSFVSAADAVMAN